MTGTARNGDVASLESEIVTASKERWLRNDPFNFLTLLILMWSHRVKLSVVSFTL